MLCVSGFSTTSPAAAYIVQSTVILSQLEIVSFNCGKIGFK
jgi:hypothetical protein